MFIDYSSAFNTIITKLRIQALNTSFCNWILDFMTSRTQVVRLGQHLLHPADTQHRGPTGVCA
jgi:hypothetical protein